MSTPKLLLASAMSLLAASVLSAAAAAQPRSGFGPVSPAFEYYRQHGPSLADTGVHPKGHIPSPLDLRHLATHRPRLLGATPPSRFDLRTLNRLTTVRDQLNCGACWAFASLASLESSLKPTENWDFSENNVKNNHGFNIASCDGGFADMAIAYLTRWNGPVRESDDRYPTTTSPTLSPVKLVEDVLVLGSRVDSTSVDSVIKQVLVDYNVAVYTAFQMDETYYDATNKSYLYRGSQPREAANHAVAIVGWDDSFAKTKFSPQAPGNGAWIVRNSWGSWWGDNGYFYVSYFDPNFGQECTAFLTPAPVSKYGIMHDYAPLGSTTTYGFGSQTAWQANIFSTQGNEILIAAGFYAMSANTSYEVYVYRNVTPGQPRSGTLALGPVSGTFAYAGYHTVSLGAGFTFTSPQRFSVVVKVTTPGTENPLVLEMPADWAPATAHAGESFVSSDGTGWWDATSLAANTNVNLKALGIGTCNDGNPCTTDNYDAAQGCTHMPTPGASCDDGLYCTQDDRCDAAAACRGTMIVGKCLIDGTTCADAFSINPSNPCEKCEPSTPNAWTPLAEGASCEDSRFCNGQETCHGGACTAGTPPSCDDTALCTSDYCDATLDECRHLLQTGFCLIDGGCYSDGVRNPANPCEACNAFTNDQVWWTLPDATSCDDSSLCTPASFCENGACKGRDEKKCPASSRGCQDGTCDPATGKCTWRAGDCDDSNPCTVQDHCEQGVCKGVDRVCEQQECKIGRCDASAGGCVQENAANGTACAKGTCQSGSCKPPGDSSGCGCASSGGPAPLFVLGLLALGLVRRRCA